MESDTRVHFLVGVNKQELLCFFFIQNYVIVFCVWLHSSALIQTLSFNTPAILGKKPWHSLETFKRDEFDAL